MKLLAFLFATLFYIPHVFGTAASNPPFSVVVDASSTNITTSYTTAPTLSGPANRFTIVQAVNTTGTDIIVNCAVTSSPGSTGVFTVPAQFIWETPVAIPSIQYPLSNMCWIKSSSGTISSGKVYLTGWGY